MLDRLPQAQFQIQRLFMLMVVALLLVVLVVDVVIDRCVLLALLKLIDAITLGKAEIIIP